MAFQKSAKSEGFGLPKTEPSVKIRFVFGDFASILGKYGAEKKWLKFLLLDNSTLFTVLVTKNSFEFKTISLYRISIFLHGPANCHCTPHRAFKFELNLNVTLKD